MDKVTDLTACPVCKSNGGYAERMIMSSEHYFEFDGTANWGSESHHVRGGKRKYCVDCGSDITKHFYNKR